MSQNFCKLKSLLVKDKYFITDGKTMKLTDFNKNNYAKRALSENYKMSFDVSKLNKVQTQRMLQKVKQLTNEAKQTSDFYKNQTSPAYMKLVFMEQALTSHYKTLKSLPSPKLVFENEAVEEAQVVLAAQDMVNTIQKMLKEIGQMQIEELPALVDSIESEIGVNEASTYNEQVSAQLDTLSGALKEAFNVLKTARNTLTPQGGSFTEPGAEGEMGADMAAGMGDEVAGMGAEAGADAANAAAAALDAGAAAVGGEEEAPEEPTNPVGRAKR